MVLFYVLCIPVLMYTLQSFMGDAPIRSFLRDLAVGILVAVPFLLIYWPLTGLVPGAFDLGASYLRHLLSLAVYPVILGLVAAYLSFGLKFPGGARFRAFMAGFLTLFGVYDALVAYASYDFFFLFMKPILGLVMILVLSITIRRVFDSWGYLAVLWGLAGALVVGQTAWVAVLYYRVEFLYSALVFFVLLMLGVVGAFFLDREA
jgi:hypothetical protein